MALDTQIHIYSVGTGVFFTNKEQRLYNKLGKLKREKNQFKESIDSITKELSMMGIESEKDKVDADTWDYISLIKEDYPHILG